MSRHSKWHKVRQFKGAIDAKRSASFTKLAREITVAAREKGADPVMNVRLRVAIDHARKASMPKDNIERAVARGAGGTGEGQLESLTYEAYAPGGTALIIECLTDNRNRSTNDVKHAVQKAGGTLASAGSVTYLFDRVGVVSVVGADRRVRPDRSNGTMDSSAGMPEGGETPPLREDVELMLIDAGATDILSDEEKTDIRCAPQDLAHLAEAVQGLGATVESMEFEWIPKITVETDEETASIVFDLIESLEGFDDVSRVSSNLA